MIADASDVFQIDVLCFWISVSFWSIFLIFGLSVCVGGLSWEKIIFLAGQDVAGLSGSCSGLPGWVIEASWELWILLESLVC